MRFYLSAFVMPTFSIYTRAEINKTYEQLFHVYDLDFYTITTKIADTLKSTETVRKYQDQSQIVYATNGCKEHYALAGRISAWVNHLFPDLSFPIYRCRCFTIDTFSDFFSNGYYYLNHRINDLIGYPVTVTPEQFAGFITPQGFQPEQEYRLRLKRLKMLHTQLLKAANEKEAIANLKEFPVPEIEPLFMNTDYPNADIFESDPSCPTT